ncbi:MAG: hypothetical protein HY671_02445 [Chloroflexi bacterium]|nr:hypothetical protein [Chloroflexota bacterium]
MPISAKEFESGYAEPAIFILGVLQVVFPNAVSLEELRTEATSNRRELSSAQLKSILDGLVNDEKVESKTFEGVIYYRYKKRPLGFGMRGR